MEGYQTNGVPDNSTSSPQTDQEGIRIHPTFPLGHRIEVGGAEYTPKQLRNAMLHDQLEEKQLFFNDSSHPLVEYTVKVDHPNPMLVRTIINSFLDGMTKRHHRRRGSSGNDTNLCQLIQEVTVHQQGNKTYTHTRAIEPKNVLRTLIESLHDPFELARKLRKEELESREQFTAPIHPINYEETIEYLKGSQIKETYITAYEAIANAIHYVQSKHGNMRLDDISFKDSNGNKIEELDAKLPVTSVSSLSVALHLGIISKQEYDQAQENQTHDTPHIIIQGFTNGGGGGMADQDIDGIIMQGLNEIVEASEAFRNGTRSFIPNITVHVIAPFQTCGKPPSDDAITKLHRKGYPNTKSGWLDAEAGYIHQWIQTHTNLQAKVILEGNSRGAYLAWLIAHQMPEISKVLYLRNPVGFYRNGKPINIKGLFDSTHLLPYMVPEDQKTKRAPIIARIMNTPYFYKDYRMCVYFEWIELIRMTTPYTEAPNTQTHIITRNNDIFVYPISTRNNPITNEQIRNIVDKHFTDTGRNTYVQRTPGNHLQPRITGDEISRRLGFVEKIFPHIDKRATDPEMANLNTTITLKLQSSGEPLFQLGLTPQHK